MSTQLNPAINYLTTKQAAEKLGWKARRVRKFALENKLSGAVKLNTWYIPRGEVEKLLGGGEKGFKTIP